MIQQTQSKLELFYCSYNMYAYIRMERTRPPPVFKEKTTFSPSVRRV
jgi:hypothetical protein